MSALRGWYNGRYPFDVHPRPRACLCWAVLDRSNFLAAAAQLLNVGPTCSSFVLYPLVRKVGAQLRLLLSRWRSNRTDCIPHDCVATARCVVAC